MEREKTFLGQLIRKLPSLSTVKWNWFNGSPVENGLAVKARKVWV